MGGGRRQPQSRAGRGAGPGLGRRRGRGARGAGHRATGTGRREPGWRRGGRALAPAAAKLGERRGRGGAERRPELCAPGRRAGSQRRASGSGPRKSRLRGRGHAVLTLPRLPSPPAPFRALLPGPGAEGGRGERERRGSGGWCGRSTPPPGPAAAEGRAVEGTGRAEWPDAEPSSGLQGEKREYGQWQSRGHKVAQQTHRTVAAPRPSVPSGCPLSCREGVRWRSEAPGAVLAGGA